jgi:serine/threonine protein phosphatase PrpC
LVFMSDNSFYNQLQQGLLTILGNGDNHPHSFYESERLGFILASSIGCIREENQDRTLFFRAYTGGSKANFVAAVLCDGMGGMIQGGKCASLATSTFVSSLVLDKEPDLLLRLKTSVQKANDAVFKKYHGEGGSTLVAVVCDESNHWIIASVGDSRIYKAKLGSSLELLTVDDTVERQLDLLGKGLNISSEFGRGLTQFVGIGDSIEVHVQSLNPQPNEMLILTSDGAYNLSKDGKVFNSLVTNAKTSQELVNRLLSVSEWFGGIDNATIAVIPTFHDFKLQKNENKKGYLEVWSPLCGQNNFFNLSSELTSTTKNSYLGKVEKPKNQSNTRKNKVSSNGISKIEIITDDIPKNSQSSFQIDIVEITP